MSLAKQEFNFTEWSNLAESDPEAFEARREDAIKEAIGRMTPDRQRRLACLQWRIDQVRKLADNPMSACIKISKMMWDSLLDQQEMIQTIANPVSLSHPLQTKIPNACILPFNNSELKSRQDLP